MTGNNRPRYISLAVKNGLAYMLLLLVACLLLGYLLFAYSKDIIKNQAIERLVQTQEVLNVEFQKYILDIEKDVTFLAQSPFLLHTMRSQWDRESHHLLSESYLNFIKIKPQYNQVRFLAYWEAGKELIRAERTKDSIRLTPLSELQNKGNRDYYLDAIQLKQGEVYFSQIDLNKEYGKISEPRMPTLRAATPIFYNDSLQGVIIINTDLREFLNKLKGYPGQTQSFYLMTHQGDFLAHPERDSTFGFEYNQSGLAQPLLHHLESLNANDQRVGLGQFRGSEISFSKWSYPRKDYELLAMLAVTNEQLFATADKWHRMSFLLMGGIVIVFGVLGILFMRRQSLQLDQITRSMTDWSPENGLSDLPVSRKDEIGRLALTFSSLSDSVQSSLNALEVEKNRAIEANRAKEEFLENMSHEIRNPLQSILSMHRVLLTNAPRKDQLPVLNTLKFSTDQLLSLVNDVLDYSLLKEGKIQLDLQPGNFENLVGRIVSSYRFEASVKQLKIILTSDESLDDLFLIDEARLTQIVSNLLSNAIKFSHESGAIWIRMEGQQETDESIEVKVSIEDEGRGMDQNAVSKLLGRFERVDENYSSETVGAGLGLPIVLNLLKLHESSLQIQSKLHKGTTCSFSLNLTKAKGKHPKDIQAYSFRNLSLYQRVLCIDDDPQILMIYRHIFPPDQYQLTEWSQLDLEDDGQFDLIISDVKLGDFEIESSLDALQSKLASYGILILSSGISGFDTERYQQLGFVRKPVEESDLYLEFRNTLIKHLSGPPDLGQIESDYDGMPEKIEKAKRLLLEQWREMSKMIVDGLKEGDEKKVERTYHKMTTTLKRIHLFPLDDLISQVVQRLTDQKAFTKDEIELIEDLLKQIEEHLALPLINTT